MNVRGYGSNIFVKIACVVFAALLWLHVTTDASFSSKYSLPIQYVGPSEGFVLASDKPDKATVVIGGPGKDLAAFYILGKLRSEKRYALVNLTGLPEGTNTVTLDRSTIHLGLFSDLRIESILYPDNASFTVKIDKHVKRTVAVDTDSLPNYKAADGLSIIGRPEAKPAFVVVKGPQDIIDRMNSIRISSLNKNVISSSDSIVPARLGKPNFVEVEPDIVDIRFRIEPVVTRQFSGIKLTLTGFPGRNRPSFNPDSLSISLSGPKSLVSAIETDNIVLAVEYKRYLDSKARGDSLITPSVSLPNGYEGIKIIDVNPRAVRYNTGS